MILKMSGPLSAPSSIVYEAPALQQEEEAPFKSHCRVSLALPPGHKVTVVSRRQSEEIQSQQDCLKIERRGVGKFFLSQIRR